MKITRKEVEKIQQLGLPPNEQIAYAYLVYTTGIDVFYKPNQVYLERQVVTNSKGQKVEVYTNTMAYEDLALVMFGFAPILFATDYHWELFLWGDSALKVTGDMDLGVPNTYFEYELEWSSEALMGVDQMNIPESIRPFATPRNPYSRRELWKSQ